MPQISQLASTYSSQIFWLLIVFGFIYFVIGRGMVGKIVTTVDARDRQIAGDLAAAQAARAEADAEEERWRTAENARRAESQALLDKAKADATAASEARLAAAGKAIEARTAEAEGRLADARRSAAAELETVAAEAASLIATRVAGLTVSDEAARGAVRELAHG